MSYIVASTLEGGDPRYPIGATSEIRMTILPVSYTFLSGVAIILQN